MIIVWVDSSFFIGSGNCSWGAVFTCPDSGERVKLFGTFHGIKSSTHAEIAGIYDCLCRLTDMYPSRKFELRTDCKSIVDLYEYSEIHKTKDLAIGRMLRKIDCEFGDIVKLTFVPGHSPKEDVSEDAARNRDAHKLAYTTAKKRKSA